MGATCAAKGWFDLPGSGRRSSSWRGEVWWREHEEAGPGAPTVRKQKAMDLWIFVLSWLAPYSTHSPSSRASHINLRALDDLSQACPEIPPAMVTLNPIKLTVKTNINALIVQTMFF